MTTGAMPGYTVSPHSGQAKRPLPWLLSILPPHLPQYLFLHTSGLGDAVGSGKKSPFRQDAFNSQMGEIPKPPASVYLLPQQVNGFSARRNRNTALFSIFPAGYPKSRKDGEVPAPVPHIPQSTSSPGRKKQSSGAGAVPRYAISSRKGRYPVSWLLLTGAAGSHGTCAVPFVHSADDLIQPLDHPSLSFGRCPPTLMQFDAPIVAK